MHKPLSQRIRIAALLSGAGASPLGALASGSPAATLSQVLANSGITASGYVAASYYYSSGYGTDHTFDVSHDTFQLDQAGLQLACRPASGFGAVVDAIAGEDAKIVDYAESAGASADPVALLQGFAQYAAGPLTVQAGKFTTLAGAEVIAPTGNTNFSRSLLFLGEPMTHTGLRVTYAITNTVTVIAGVNDGWNYSTVSYGPKTGELGIALTPNRHFSLTAQAYAGRDPLDLASRQLFDAVATYEATAALSFVLSYDWGRQDASPVTAGGGWQGVAAYVNYRSGPRWRVSLRGEYFDDETGFITGAAQKLEEGTITFGYDPAPDFELRLEGRYDISSVPTFVKKIRPTVTVLADDQAEVAVQGVFEF
ncbi:MAG: outer membrane beta-barrel protein [Steroidobacteraceae bacterium]